MSKDQEDFTKIGFVYAAILLVFSNVIADDWQNDEIFYLLGIYPYFTGLIFWMVIGYLAATIKPSFGGILCLGGLAAYNYGLIQKIINGDDETLLFIDRLWSGNKLGVIIFTAFYLGGQLFIVGIISKRNFAEPNAI
jgi:hypothetical protein